MSDYVALEDFESKLSIVVRKPQEGKTFICINSIICDINKKNIHIVMTMNTLSSGMQFFGRMEEKIGSTNVIVFNSKKQTAGNCHHAKTVSDVYRLIQDNPKIKVIVCCAHEKRIRKSVIDLIRIAGDSCIFTQAKRGFMIHIDEAHKYITENRDCIREYNNSQVVNSIIGYSGTPDGIWMKDQSDQLFHKILIRDVERELQIIRSPDYFGVNCCEFHIFEEVFTHDEIVSIANIDNDISQTVIVRSNMIEQSKYQWYGNRWCFSLGNEKLLLSYISQIIPTIQASPDTFSYHFVPAYTRKATHYEIVEIILRICPTANVITINGNGFELYRLGTSDNKSYKMKSGNNILQRSSVEERKVLGEPSNMIQELIKNTRNCPTFVTGHECVQMSVTLINEDLGNFDSVIMAHQHYSPEKLYQFCRFLFNYTMWSQNARRKIKKTKFYSLTKIVVDICLDYEKSVEYMSSYECAGKTVTLREAHGLDPEEPSDHELRLSSLLSIKLLNPNKLWKKFKVYDGNQDQEWQKMNLFYHSIMKKKPTNKSRPKLVDGFFQCSTTSNVKTHSLYEINKLNNQSWWSTFQLTPTSLSYCRIFVGYENLEDPSEYTIFVKYALLEDSESNKTVLKKYGKKTKVIARESSDTTEF